MSVASKGQRFRELAGSKPKSTRSHSALGNSWRRAEETILSMTWPAVKKSGSGDHRRRLRRAAWCSFRHWFGRSELSCLPDHHGPQAHCRAVSFAVVRVDHQRVRNCGLRGQPHHHSEKDPFVAPSLPAAAEGLGRTTLSGRVTPPEAIAIDQGVQTLTDNSQIEKSIAFNFRKSRNFSRCPFSLLN